jgi:hypothetical protein
MNKIINDLLTGKDNQTHDLVRWSLLYSILVLTAGLIFNAVHTGLFDIEKFYLGSAALVGAHGFGLMMKKGTEPEEQ